MIKRPLHTVVDYSKDSKEELESLAKSMSTEELQSETIALGKSMLQDNCSSIEKPKSSYDFRPFRHAGDTVFFISRLYTSKSNMLKVLLYELRNRGINLIGESDNEFNSIQLLDSLNELATMIENLRVTNKELHLSIRPTATADTFVILSSSTVGYVGQEQYKNLVLLERAKRLLRKKEDKILLDFELTLPKDKSALVALGKELSSTAISLGQSPTKQAPYVISFVLRDSNGVMTRFFKSEERKLIGDKIHVVRKKIRELEKTTTGSSSSNSKSNSDMSPKNTIVTSQGVSNNTLESVSDKIIYCLGKTYKLRMGNEKINFQQLSSFANFIISNPKFNDDTKRVVRHLVNLAHKYLTSKNSTDGLMSFSRVTRLFLYSRDCFILARCRKQGIGLSALNDVDSDYYTNKSSAVLQEYRNKLDSGEI